MKRSARRILLNVLNDEREKISTPNRLETWAATHVANADVGDVTFW